MELIKKLIKSGLTEKEASIYQNLVIQGGNTPGRIAQDTKINRTTVYKILNKLAIQGLISEIKKGNKKFFQVEKPERLINAANYKVQIAKESCNYAETIIPCLKALINKSVNKPKVQFYNTYATVVQAYMEHVELDTKYEMFSFFSPVNLKNFLPHPKFKHYIKEKERLGITVRAIASEKNYVTEFKKDMFTGIEKSIWPKIKIVHDQVFPFPGEVTLYGNDKVSIVKFDKDNPVAVVIHDRDVYIMLKSIFDMVWHSAKKT
jgi:sugar-specific transcriptional regulator TrmB